MGRFRMGAYCEKAAKAGYRGIAFWMFLARENRCAATGR